MSMCEYWVQCVASAYACAMHASLAFVLTPHHTLHSLLPAMNPSAYPPPPSSVTPHITQHHIPQTPAHATHLYHTAAPTTYTPQQPHVQPQTQPHTPHTHLQAQMATHMQQRPPLTQHVPTAGVIYPAGVTSNTATPEQVWACACMCMCHVPCGMCMCMCMCMCIHVGVHACICVIACACACACCMCMCMYACDMCMYVCMWHVHACMHVGHVHVACACGMGRVFVLVCMMCMCMCMCMYLHAYVHAGSHAVRVTKYELVYV